MNAAERLELIRAKCPRKELPQSAKPRGYGLIVRAGDKPTAYAIGPRLSRPDRVVDWVTAPDEREQEWQPSQRHGPHALTRIAERLKRR